MIILLSCAALIAVGLALCVKCWPFSQGKVLQDLADATDSTVTIRSYHPTYFPVPGCVLSGVEFHHGKQQTDLITIQKLRILGSYRGVLTGYVPRVVVEGARLLIPPLGSATSFHSKHSGIVIGEVTANGTLVEFTSNKADQKPLTFGIHEALLSGVRWGAPIGYRLKFRNPNPTGEISVSGKFGSWAEGHPGDTPISGDYTFETADLGVYDGIGGRLASTGSFRGFLKHINVSGTADTPDFELKSTGHKVRLQSQFQAYVNAQNGDTFLNHVEAQFGRTMVVAEGSIARSEESAGKSAKLRLTSRNGRIEDVLGLFVSSPRAPMTGTISIVARAEIPPGSDQFLDKVLLRGGFGIGEGKFTHPDTQRDVDKLSADAQGKDKEDPRTVLTNLNGRVDLKHGVAYFSDVQFGVPGADAEMHGTYNIINHAINLHGTMRVGTSISKTSSGIKALLLKMMDPFFKKEKKGEVVPVHILGTYERPEFGLDLTNKDDAKRESK